MMNNKVILAAGLGLTMVFALFLFLGFGDDGPEVTVYKSPSCECCSKWVDHIEDDGFDASVENVSSIAIVKNKFEIDRNLQACHTAVIDGYVVEGHVPADLVRKMLKEQPDIKGLAVPGMPQGSPGMEMGGVKEPYEVLTFDEEGNTTVYARRNQ